MALESLSGTPARLADDLTPIVVKERADPEES